MKLSKSKIIGLIALLAVVGVVCGTLVWRQSQPAPAEPTEQVSITGYLGGEKIGLFDDAKFKALAAKQGIAIDYRKAGSPAMMDTDRKGMGYLFPSSRAAVEYGNAKGVKAPQSDIVFNSPIVLYTHKAVNQTDAFKQIKDDVVIVYPTPTVWSTHTLMALDEKGDTLLNLLKTPAAQKLAWERHGFRAANFAGTDSISRFGVAGTLDQIPAVSELPNNDAMQHLITTLQSAQAKLVADISMYDTMYTQNAQQYRELKMTVLAGKKALADFNANQLPALEAEAAASGDAMQAQVLKDFKSKLDRFAKRLDDLDRISVVTLQTAPQIKIIQNADQTIVDKIDTTISTTIPVWKSQMVIALGLSNQRKALDLQNKADEVTNKLLARNAAALHKGAVDAEKANQRSVVEIDTLEKINAELVATLKETVQIQKEGKANREAAQVKMRQIESDLKNALLENAQQM